MRRHAPQRVHMIRTDMATDDLDVARSTDLADQIVDLRRHVPAERRLATLRAEHEVVVALIDGMGGSAIPFHGPRAYRKPPEGEGFHPSQTVTVSQLSGDLHFEDRAARPLDTWNWRAAKGRLECARSFAERKDRYYFAVATGHRRLDRVKRNGMLFP
jgi:hypothetical protein